MKRKQILIACTVAATAIFWMLWSYVSFNRPECPICKSDGDVRFTWKSYYSRDGEPVHKLTNLLFFGLCEHNCSPTTSALPRPHFAWFCYKCSKQIRKPAGWRSGQQD